MCDSDSCFIDFLHAVFQTVVVELQSGSAEGVRLDHRRAGFDIGFVDLLHDIGLFEIHELGAAAGL